MPSMSNQTWPQVLILPWMTENLKSVITDTLPAQPSGNTKVPDLLGGGWFGTPIIGYAVCLPLNLRSSICISRDLTTFSEQEGREK